MYLNIPPKSLKVLIGRLWSMGLIVYKYGGGGGGLQLIRGRIQEYVVSCGMITHHFNMFGIVDRMR